MSYLKMLVRWVAIIFVFLGSLTAQSLDVIFALEMSPGTEQMIGLIRPRDLQDSDRAAVIGFLQSAQMLQPFTESREELAAGLRRAGARLAVGFGGGQLPLTSPADITGALNMACREFGEDNPTDRKRAIILYFASEDPALGAHIDSLTVKLKAANARLFAFPIQRVPEPGVARGPGWAAYPFPVIAARFLSQLTKASRGRMVKRGVDLKKLLAEARKP